MKSNITNITLLERSLGANLVPSKSKKSNKQVTIKFTASGISFRVV